MADQPAVSFDALLPPQIAEACERVGAAKARMDLVSTLVLAGLAGAFISLGAMLFTVTVTEAELGFGPTRILGGGAVSLGLALGVIAGGGRVAGDTLLM